MRHLVVVFLLVAMAACETGAGTNPDATVIRVRLRDDQAHAAGRNTVLVTPPSGVQFDAHTGSDGVVDIIVAGAGVYQLRVVPRAFYLSNDALSRSVTVAEKETAIVDFLLHVSGISVGEGDPAGLRR